MAMTATAAEIGYGILLKMLTSTGPDVYTTLGNQRDVTPPDGFEVDIIDATHNASPDTTEEVIPGIVRTKEVEVEIEYNVNSATVALIKAAQRVLKTFRWVHPAGHYIQFQGYITNFETEAPTEEKQVASVTIKRSGAASTTAASAPSNLVLPSMSGIVQVGQTLTAYVGVWANEPTSFTYVWKNEGVAISGATGSTYVLQSGDEGDNISLTVTATNSAGSASATSHESVAVAAA
jgi:hypothetical protein